MPVTEEGYWPLLPAHTLYVTPSGAVRVPQLMLTGVLLCLIKSWQLTYEAAVRTLCSRGLVVCLEFLGLSLKQHLTQVDGENIRVCFETKSLFFFVFFLCVSRRPEDKVRVHGPAGGGSVWGGAAAERDQRRRLRQGQSSGQSHGWACSILTHTIHRMKMASYDWEPRLCD